MWPTSADCRVKRLGLDLIEHLRREMIRPGGGPPLKYDRGDRQYL